MKAQEINNMVINYRRDSDRRTLDKIAKHTVRLIYKFGKSYKIPTCELNSLYGVALMKSVKSWREDGQASFTSYLSAVIINELRMYLRRKQQYFEATQLNEIRDFPFDEMLTEEDKTDEVNFKLIIDRIVNEFPKEKTRQALKMYYGGAQVEYIVKHLRIGRTNFYADLKTFKELLREEMEQCNTDLMKTERQL